MSGFLALAAAYHPAAEAFFARADTAGVMPDEARRVLYSAVFDALDTAGILSKTQHLTVPGANQTIGLLNLVGSSFNNVVIGGGVYTTDRYYVPTFGGGNALNSGYTPSTHAAAVDDLSLGIMYGANSPSGTADAGCQDATYFAEIWPLISSDNKTVAKLNHGGGAAYRFGPATPGGLTKTLIVASLVPSSTLAAYWNGVAQTRSGSEAGAAGLPTVPIYFGGYNNNGAAAGVGSAQVMVTFIGQGLTSGENAALYAALSPYLTAIGAV